jgi:hypothetical protein
MFMESAQGVLKIDKSHKLGWSSAAKATFLEGVIMRRDDDFSSVSFNQSQGMHE